MSAPKTTEERVLAHDRAQRYCNPCPRLCRHSCPVENAERDESVTPQEKNTLVRLTRLGARPLDEDSASRFWKCTGCGLCQTFCGHENDVAGSLFAARAVAVEAGVHPGSVQAVRDRFEQSGNQYGVDLTERTAEVPPDRRVGTGGPVGRDRGRVPVDPSRGLSVYWPGCTTLHDHPQLVQTTLDVADRLGGADLTVYCGKVQCCGYPLLAAGDTSLFRAQAESAAEALDGADRVFTGAPECAWTMKHAWPEVAGVELEAEVMPLVDLLADGLEHAPQGPPLEEDLAWHDPCYLGRGLGRYDAPRELLERLNKTPAVTPAPWDRERGYCSGGGGLLPQTSPETADAIARSRAADLTGTTSGPPGEAPPGDRRIVSACPSCTTRFRAAGARASDLVELVALYLGLQESLDLDPEKPNE